MKQYTLEQFQTKLNKIYCCDCLKGMRAIPDKSIDMILCDLPYGITARNKWDTIIPLNKLWEQYKRIIKDEGAIVLTAIQPFSSQLVMSNVKLFKYEWIWHKSRPVGFLNAKKQPLREHESILVFYKKQPIYNLFNLKKCDRVIKRTTVGTNYNEAGLVNRQTRTGFPRSILKMASEAKTKHPTQKPVKLFEYLIKTYTNEGDLVLDNCLGSRTTAVACKKLNRNFIGFDISQEYCKIARERLKG